jgi:hypothetical protein
LLELSTWYYYIYILIPVNFLTQDGALQKQYDFVHYVANHCYDVVQCNRLVDIICFFVSFVVLDNSNIAQSFVELVCSLSSLSIFLSLSFSGLKHLNTDY